MATWNCLLCKLLCPLSHFLSWYFITETGMKPRQDREGGEAYMCLCVLGHVGARGPPQVSFIRHPPHWILRKNLSLAYSSPNRENDWSESFKDLPVSAFPVLGYKCRSPHPASLHEIWGSNQVLKCSRPELNLLSYFFSPNYDLLVKNEC